MKLKLLVATAACAMTTPASAGVQVIDFENYALGATGPFRVALESNGLGGTWVDFFAGEIVEFNGSKALRVPTHNHPTSNGYMAIIRVGPPGGSSNYLIADLAHYELTIEDGGWTEIFGLGSRYLGPGETGIFDRTVYPYGDPYSRGSFRISFYSNTGHAYLDNLRFGERIGISVPEPGTWAMLIAGFGAVGAAVRRRKRLCAPAL